MTAARRLRSAVDRMESLLPGSRDAASNFAYLSIPRYVGFVIELAASIYIARKLGPESYGILATVYAFVSLFRFVPDLGTTALVIRDVARDNTLAASYLANTILLRTVLGTASIGLVNLIAFLAGYDDIERHYIFIYSLVLVIDPFSQTPFVFGIALRRFRLTGACQLFYRVVVSALPALVLFLGFKLDQFLWASVGAFGLGCASFPLVFTQMKVAIRPSFDPARIRYLVLQGFPIAIGACFYMFETRIDRIMLSSLATMEAVGIYAIAARIMTAVVEIILAPVDDMVLPTLSRAYAHSVHAMLAKAVKYAAFLLLCYAALSLGLTLLGRTLVTWIWGLEFADSANALQIVIWATLFISVNQLGYRVLTVVNAQKLFLAVQVLSASLNIAMNAWLIPKVGYLGPAYATVASTAVASFVTVLLVARVARASNAAPSGD